MMRLRFAVLLAIGALASGCATTGAGHEASVSPNAPAPQRETAHDARIDRDARTRIAREDTLTQMTFWAAEYSAHPEDLEAAQKFAEALRAGGRNDRAAEVAREALGRHDGDRPLLTSLGLALLSANHPQEALQPLALVAHADAQDWRSRCALGVALDQLGRSDEARRAYQEALAIRPEEPSVLTNLGVSYLLGGDAAQAETILRRAVAAPNAPVAARQNLALAVGLQGRFDEAEQLERIDLPPAAVAQNMSFIRDLLSDGRRWSDVGERDVRRQ